MNLSSNKNRIIFIDLMRAFAVLMMVQGHTIDVLLSNNYRNADSPFFSSWLFMRGMTAPIFMFTAGTVFMYLFRSIDRPFKDNPRVIKGLKRFLLLLGLGYLLRYPSSTIFDFSIVTNQGWNIFFGVDVLHLIGFGILILIICAFIAEKSRLKDYIIFSAAGISFFLLFPIFDKINWIEIFPKHIAGYFYTGTGSIFPLFPWAGFVICGGVLGSYLAKNPIVFRTSGFSLKLAVIGFVLIILSFLSYPVEKYFYGKNIADLEYIDVILLRVGFVLLLYALVSFISIRIESIPRFIILIGRNTLLIYVVHLMILYGSAWNPGLNQLFEKSFNVWNTIGTALIMISLMTAMVVVINKLKIRNKQLIT